tara:strand:+ start:1106 stop:2485 length:1380 start_codon:yes stop_codon:yes gene_type:complete
VVTEAIQAVKNEVKEGKISWEDSPFQEVKSLGKNSVAAFGEHLYNEYQKSVGLKSKVVRCEHDVLVSDSKKIEIKTAFQNKNGTFFFNQIRYHLPAMHERAGEEKNWDTLAFVFVKPHRVEIWECPRPQDPENHFVWNNDYSWNKKDSDKLNSNWTCVYEYDHNEVKAGHREKQSYANKRVTGKEQYYTKPDVVDLCIQEVRKHVNLDDKTILEPCGGTGEFIEGFLRVGVGEESIISYDIEPKHDLVQEGDYLKTEFKNQKDLVCITNPPFGRMSSLAKKFFNHGTTHCEYICFLVPKSWRKWSTHNSLDKNFHLIADIDLPQNCFYQPDQERSKKDVLNTVFQIWQRRDEARTKIKVPDNGLIQKILPDDNKKITGANFSIVAFGHSCGRCSDITEDVVDYKTTTMYLKVERDDVKKALRKIDLSKYFNNVAYVQALSIQEINYELNEYFKLENFKF